MFLEHMRSKINQYDQITIRCSDVKIHTTYIISRKIYHYTHV